MRLWQRYLYEKRQVMIFHFIMVFMFVIVGSLYHLEHLGKYLYAALLTLVIWGMAGIRDGMKYVRRSRQLEDMARHFRQSGDLVLGEWEETLTAAGRMEDAKDYEQALWFMISRIFEAKEAERTRQEERAAEWRDYCIMWTHQIKTPISAMRLLLENTESRGRNDFLMREELFKIEQYAEMVLTFQRLESISSDLVLQEYDLYSMLKTAVKKYAVLFINKGLSLELQETQMKVLTDKKWFVFCVEQILSNSIKYTAEGKIMVKVCREEKSSEDLKGEKPEVQAVLSIEDTGIGIRQEDLPRIFEKGFTGYNGRLEKKSTGVGLYLCRKVFLHLGIRVKVESEEGRGTKVILKLPCERVKQDGL